MLEAAGCMVGRHAVPPRHEPRPAQTPSPQEHNITDVSLESGLTAFDLTLPASAGATIDVRPLPTRAGVFVVFDDDNRPLQLVATADIRRRVRDRLRAEPGTPRRIDPAVARHIRGATSGSPFETDWVTLEFARHYVPSIYRSLLDQWQAWFVCCDPDSDHPRFLKKPEPAAAGLAVGPIGDKHLAQRVVERIESAYDLCRDHRLLLQTPNAAACAYKEMGRCKAPCDGSLPFADYRALVREACDFLGDGIQVGRAGVEAKMTAASSGLAFEEAARLRRVLDETAELERPQLRSARSLATFRMVAIMPSERKGFARVFLIAGGALMPLMDVQPETGDQLMAELIVSRLRATTITPPDGRSLENLGLLTRHLSLPAAKQTGVFLNDGPDIEREVRGALRRIARGTKTQQPPRETELLP